MLAEAGMEAEGQDLNVKALPTKRYINKEDNTPLEALICVNVVL